MGQNKNLDLIEKSNKELNIVPLIKKQSKKDLPTLIRQNTYKN